MIRFDKSTFTLPRLWVAVGVLVFIDFVWLAPLVIGNPIGSWFIQMLPHPVAGTLLIFGPAVVAVLWLVIVIFGAAIHGRRGFWLLLAAPALFPATYLNLVIMAFATADGF